MPWAPCSTSVSPNSSSCSSCSTDVWQDAVLVVPLGEGRAWRLTDDTPSSGRWPNVAVSADLQLEPGVPVIVDADGNPRLSLDPVARFDKPSPDAYEELFVLDGGA